MKDHEYADRIVYCSQTMRELIQYIEELSSHHLSVLIHGETGVGKELIARIIYESSPRAKNPFIAINCAAFPDSLIESELFGHERGSFTGASQERRGKFELANEGTLFLDEIGDMSLVVQAKLLRVLQDGTFYRIGSDKVRHCDVRVIAATNKNLEEEIEKGNFRADLYYRLSEDHVFVPPLRQRREDIPVLIDYFFKIYSKGNHSGIACLTYETLMKLEAYDWPGNVRELSNCIQLLLCHQKDKMIEPHHLPKKLHSLPDAGNALCDRLNEVINTAPLQDLQMDLVNNVERSLIEKVLKETQGRKKASAKMLRISLNTLKTKMRKYNIPDYTKIGEITTYQKIEQQSSFAA